jgi:hypothetical protein
MSDLFEKAVQRAEAINNIRQREIIGECLDATQYMDLLKVPETFSDIRSHLSANKPFAQITAWRPEYNTQQNRERNIDLINDLRSSGYGGVKLKGRYNPPGTSDVYDEISFFVPFEGNNLEQFKQTIMRLTGKYNQDSALFSDGKSVVFLKSSGSIDKILKPSAQFDQSDLKGGWSQLRGHNYQFLEAGFVLGNNLMQVYASVGLRSNLIGNHVDFKNGYLRKH